MRNNADDAIFVPVRIADAWDAVRGMTLEEHMDMYERMDARVFENNPCES